MYTHTTGYIRGGRGPGDELRPQARAGAGGGAERLPAPGRHARLLQRRGLLLRQRRHRHRERHADRRRGPAGAVPHPQGLRPLLRRPRRARRVLGPLQVGPEQGGRHLPEPGQ